MKVKKLVWAPSKTYRSGGKNYRISVKASLDDECHNMTCDFSITGNVYEQKRNGEWEHYTGGCIHDVIVRHFPELKKFIPLHLSNYLGQPMYPEANGQYHIKQSGIKVAMEYMRCQPEEFTSLSFYCENEDRPYFKYLLFKLGLVDRWKKEADEFIKFLEEKTGNEWENPYKPEEERFVLRMTDQEREEIEKKEKDNFYSVENVNKRIEERKRLRNEAIRQKVIDDCESKCKKEIEERDVKLYIFDSGLPLNNVIFYSHTKEAVFNWLDYESKITKEQFDEFLSKVDYSKLPEGVTFHFGKKDKK